MALACVLLVGAGLLFRSFRSLLQVNLGFQPQHAMSWRVDSPRSFNSRAEANEYLDGVVRTVAALPGVEAVGLSDVLPLGRNRTWGVRAKGVEYPPGQGPSVFPRMVDQHYLQAMQILFEDPIAVVTALIGQIEQETQSGVMSPLRTSARFVKAHDEQRQNARRAKADPDSAQRGAGLDASMMPLPPAQP